jgi:hypothetical protein
MSAEDAADMFEEVALAREPDAEGGNAEEEERGTQGDPVDVSSDYR